jgi:hypothetical protein
VLAAVPVLGLLGGIIKWAVDQRRMRIVVSISLGRYRRSTFEWAYVENLKGAAQPDKGSLERLGSATTYVEMKLLNRSKKALKNINISLPYARGSIPTRSREGLTYYGQVGTIRSLWETFNPATARFCIFG